MDEKMVKSPPHYVEGRKFEPKDVIRDWRLNFNLGNAVKYVCRAGRKGDAVEDLMKAQEYIQYEIDALKDEAINKADGMDTMSNGVAYVMAEKKEKVNPANDEAKDPYSIVELIVSKDMPIEIVIRRAISKIVEVYGDENS